MKLNLACGENRIEGWINHDNDVDLTQPLPWPDNSAECILLEHICEHMSGPQGLRLFDECHRVLKLDGVLRVCVPTLPKLSLEKQRDIILNHGHQMVYCLHTLQHMLKVARFKTVTLSLWKECDGHWKIIGHEQDELETLRVEATKL